MSEEQTVTDNVNSNVLADNNIDTAKEKQSNRTFTQSEVDKMLKGQSETEASKKSDYDAVMSELKQLKIEKQERIEAEQTDLEKSNGKNEQLEKKINELNSLLSGKEQSIIKQEVLNDPKFADMPSAYKQLVKLSDNREEVSTSADEQLLQYHSDFKIKTDFGIPKELKNDKAASGNDPLNQEALKQKLRGLLKR